MQKVITQDRVRQTLISISDRLNRITADDQQVVQSSALLGLKAMAGIDTQCDREKFGLEMDYLGVPKDRALLQESVHRFRYQVDRFGARRDAVRDIQKRHNVSGLVESTIVLGGKSLPVLWQDDHLTLIDQDVRKLSIQKKDVFSFWIDHALLNGLELYESWGRESEYWRPAIVNKILAALPFYDWARAWERITYTSPSRMLQYGYDEVRSSPLYPDDKKYWEVGLLLGTGCDTDSPDSSKYFCACNEFPHY